MSTENMSAFKEALESQNWDVITDIGDVNLAYSTFLQRYTSL